MSDAALIFSTAPDPAVARSLAEQLIEKRLAACVQMTPIHSVYHWQGGVQGGEETLMLIKTRASLFDDIAALWRTAHPYDTPELVMTDITAIEPAYRDWLMQRLG